MTLFIARSAIGVICATAEVRIVENCEVGEKTAVVVIGVKDRLVAMTLAFIVKEKFVFVGI